MLYMHDNGAPETNCYVQRCHKKPEGGHVQRTSSKFNYFSKLPIPLPLSHCHIMSPAYLFWKPPAPSRLRHLMSMPPKKDISPRARAHRITVTVAPGLSPTCSASSSPWGHSFMWYCSRALRNKSVSGRKRVPL